MNKYRVTLLVPHERTIEAVDMEAANQEAQRLTHVGETAPGQPKAVLHSIECVDCEDPPLEAA